MEIAGAVDPDGYDDEPPWPSRLAPGTLAEVLCLTLDERDDGPGGTRVVEGVIAPEPTLANPLGNLHGGVFAAAAEVAGAAVFPHEREVSSSSLDVRYVRQIPLVQPVTVRAEVLHDGRSWGIAQVTTRDEGGGASVPWRRSRSTATGSRCHVNQVEFSSSATRTTRGDRT